jgi:hypothetical protein
MQLSSFLGQLQRICTTAGPTSNGTRPPRAPRPRSSEARRPWATGQRCSVHSHRRHLWGVAVPTCHPSYVRGTLGGSRSKASLGAKMQDPP